MRSRKVLWKVTIRNRVDAVWARTFGGAVRKAYRVIAAEFRRTSGLDKYGNERQFPPLTSNRDGEWDEASAVVANQ